MSSRFYFNSLKTNSKIAFQLIPVIVNDVIEFSTYNFIANTCSFFDFKTIFLEKRYNLLYLRFGLIDEKMHRSLRITRHYLLISKNTAIFLVQDCH